MKLRLPLIALLATTFAQADDPAPKDMVAPEYNAEGELLLPKNYEDWVFVGASLGLSYNEEVRREGPGLFHHVYIQPQAYKHYKETGKFPDKTMLVMENFTAGSKENPNLHGYFEDQHVGLEVALKDTENHEDRWAYYNFSAPKGFKPAARAFPKAVCWDCHDQHAADDNVFVQFYPVLKREMVKQGRWKELAEAAPKEEGAPDKDSETYKEGE